jgi:hypothetical protein
MCLAEQGLDVGKGKAAALRRVARLTFNGQASQTRSISRILVSPNIGSSFHFNNRTPCSIRRRAPPPLRTDSKRASSLQLLSQHRRCTTPTRPYHSQLFSSRSSASFHPDRCPKCLQRNAWERYVAFIASSCSVKNTLYSCRANYYL